MSIESIEEKILNILKSREYVEVEEVGEILSKVEMIYLIVNIPHFQKILICDIDTKRFIPIGDYYAPYLKIKKI